MPFAREGASLVVHSFKPCNFLINPTSLILAVSVRYCQLHAACDQRSVYHGHQQVFGFDNFSAMAAAAGVYWQVSSNRLGEPHLCLALDLELATATGLDKDDFPRSSR